MVLFAIGRSPRLRSMTNVFLANLAVADFFIGIFCVLPNLSTFLQPKWFLGREMCKIFYYIWNVCYIASISILTVIAIERYLVILHPLNARNILTRNWLTCVQVGIWSSALVNIIPYLVLYDLLTVGEYIFLHATMENERHLKWFSLTNISVCYCIPLLLIAVLYYRVARVLWKTTVISALRLKSNTEYCMTATSSIKLSPQSSYDQCNDVDNTQERDIVINGFNNDSVRSHRPNMYRSAFMTSTKRVAKARRKVIRLLIFVVITFTFCVFPHMLKVLDHYWSFLKLSQQTMLMLSPICFIEVYINSAMNPFLYAMFSANFRRNINESFHCCKI